MSALSLLYVSESLQKTLNDQCLSRGRPGWGLRMKRNNKDQRQDSP